jgi:hypothetical protein
VYVLGAVGIRRPQLTDFQAARLGHENILQIYE